jgi:hypothetical protein
MVGKLLQRDFSELPYYYYYYYYRSRGPSRESHGRVVGRYAQGTGRASA